jgi:hypothetical protein
MDVAIKAGADVSWTEHRGICGYPQGNLQKSSVPISISANTGMIGGTPRTFIKIPY